MRIVTIAVFCGLVMSFTLRAEERERSIPPLLCGANAQFQYAGMYYGTLPYENPASKRKEFMALLKEKGIRAIRFPGGQEVQFYLPEDVESMTKPPLNIRSYPEGDPQKLTSVWDFLDFCREAGITPIFQAGTYTYSDGTNAYKLLDLKRQNHFSNLPQGNRGDAADALKKFLINARKRGYPIRNVELGNEEYAFMPVEAYYETVVRYIAAIKEAEPEAAIWITLGANLVGESDRKLIYPWAETLVKKLAAAGFNRNPRIGFTLHYVWPEYIRLYSKLLKENGFTPRLAVTEFHMAGNGNYTDLCPRYGYALSLAQFLIDMAPLAGLEIMCIHDLTGQNFGIIHYNQKSYVAPDFKSSWDSSLGYRSMPSAYVYQLFNRLTGGRIVAGDAGPDNQLTVELDGERRIFLVNNNVNPRSVRLGKAVTGWSNRAFECDILTPASAPSPSAKPGTVSAEALGAANHGGDPLRKDQVELKHASGEIGEDGLLFTVPSHGIACFRCYNPDTRKTERR